jgi:hypothetical protein
MAADPIGASRSFCICGNPLTASHECPVDEIPSRAGTVARGGSGVSEACTDSARDLADWVCATLDYLVLNEPRPSSLDDYVSKPTLARKAKDKVELLARRADALEATRGVLVTLRDHHDRVCGACDEILSDALTELDAALEENATHA